MADPEPDNEAIVPESSDSGIRWGLGDVAAGFVVAVLAGAIFASTFASRTGLTDAEAKRSLGLAAAGMFGLWVGFVGVPVLSSYRKGQRSLRKDFGLEFKLPRDLIRGVGLGIIGQILVYVLYLPVLIISPDTAAKVSDPAKQFTGLAPGWQAIPLGLLLVVGAPFAEELFFRGLTLRALTRRFGPTIAIIASAVLFGLTHQELLQLPALIGFGALLAISARRTGRLGENIFAHMTFNLIPFAYLVITR